MSKQKTLEEFLKKAKSIHGEKYDYSLSCYSTAFNKIKIICKIHGIFEQRPHDHLRPRGCPKCANLIRAEKTGNSKRLNLDFFINKSKIIHNNRYIYKNSYYAGMHKKITITCPLHGDFDQAAHSHLDGCGCPKCGLGNNSKVEKLWLDSYNIKEEYRQYYVNIDNKRFFVDGFDPITNTIYEFYGDFWHGNPNIFNTKDINPLVNKTYGQLYLETLNRELIFKNFGYKIISIWESEYHQK